MRIPNKRRTARTGCLRKGATDCWTKTSTRSWCADANKTQIAVEEAFKVKVTGCETSNPRRKAEFGRRPDSATP